MTDAAVMGIDLGGTKLAGAVFSRNGKLLRKTMVPLAGRRGRAVGELVCDQIKHVLGVARARRIKVSATSGFVGFHPMCELPLTFFTRIAGV